MSYSSVTQPIQRTCNFLPFSVHLDYNHLGLFWSSTTFSDSLLSNCSLIFFQVIFQQTTLALKFLLNFLSRKKKDFSTTPFDFSFYLTRKKELLKRFQLWFFVLTGDLFGSSVLGHLKMRVQRFLSPEGCLLEIHYMVYSMLNQWLLYGKFKMSERSNIWFRRES